MSEVWTAVGTGLMVAVAAVLAVLCVRMAWRMKRLRQRIVAVEHQVASLRAQADAEHRLVSDTFDALSAGVVLYDTDDRILMFNADFRRLYADLGDVVRPGVPFEQVLRAAVDRGLVPEAREDAESWIQARVATHGRPGAPTLRRTPDGRWRRLSEQRLPDGKLLAFSVDVSDLVEREHELAQVRAQQVRAAQRLEDAVSALPHGFALFDAEDRLVMCNARYRELFRQSADALQPGQSFEQILRHGLARGQFPQAVGREDAWLRETLARRAEEGQDFLRELPGDQWLSISKRRTRDGGITGVFTDVTDQVHRERALEAARAEAQQAQRLLRESVDALPAGVEVYDDQDRLVLYNDQLARMYPVVEPQMRMGCRFEELARASLRLGLITEARGQEEAWLQQRMAQRARHSEPLLQRLSNGQMIHVHETRTRSGNVVAVRLDVSDLVRSGEQLSMLNQKLDESRAQLQAIISTASSVILTVNEAGQVVFANRALTVRLGWPVDELLGRPVERLLDRPLPVAPVPVAMPSPGEPSGDGAAVVVPATGAVDVMARHRDGHALAMQLEVSAYLVGSVQHRVCLLTDVSERVATAQALRDANERLAALSDTDGLTGLANRRCFDRRLREEWERAVRHGLPLALLMIDVDHFKRFNDLHGHQAGDDCLREVASTLASCAVRATDLVARYGGEEFVVLLPHTQAADARRVAEQIDKAMARLAYPHGASPVSPVVTLSMGVAASRPGVDFHAATLVRHADDALYRAKQLGRHGIVTAAVDA